jgi:hypothetical protein
MTDSSGQNVPARATRIADADREAMAKRLRDASTEGRLDFNELEERLSAVFAAKTRGELDALIADLPAAQTTAIEPLALRTKSGSLKKKGCWRVPSRISAECTSGSIKIDFTEAECLHREVTVEVSARSGSVVLIVPKGWAVNLDKATASSGSIVNKVSERPAAGAPVLRVSGKAVSGTIKARYPRRSFRDWLFRRPV